MKKYFLIIVFAFSSLSIFSQQEKGKEVTTYYLIRHAEKVRTDKNNKNPFLNYKGLKRANYWATVFSNIKFDMVYCTDYNRTKQTASPTAKKNNLELYLYNPRDMYNDVFKYNTKGKTVLIVGHSNTTPFFANKILGENKYKQIEDNNNNNLYIVTVTKDSKTGVLLNVAH